VRERLRVYLREQKDGAMPGSRYGQAIGSVLDHWDELRRSTEDGHLEMDNNTAGRTLRLCAISRKKCWLMWGKWWLPVLSWRAAGGGRA
jgi:hypothetical protein